MFCGALSAIAVCCCASSCAAATDHLPRMCRKCLRKRSLLDVHNTNTGEPCLTTNKHGQQRSITPGRMLGRSLGQRRLLPLLETHRRHAPCRASLQDRCHERTQRSENRHDEVVASAATCMHCNRLAASRRFDTKTVVPMCFERATSSHEDAF